MRAVSTPLVLVPLLITPGLLLHYDVTPKAIVLLAGAAAALALYRPFRLLDLLLGAQAISLVERDRARVACPLLPTRV